MIYSNMRRIHGSAIGTLALLTGALSGAQSTDAWTRTFSVGPRDLGPTGRNPYFVLEPGHQVVFTHADERLTITVTNRTLLVGGVETRVVEERETKGGALVEVSRNYFAISRKDSSVYYFGEDVDMYKAGTIVSHAGAWRSGVNGARFGLMMPARPALHQRFYQEVAPGIAMDRAEIVSTTEPHTLPGVTYSDVIKVEETTPLEPGQKEYKWYARGIGLIADGSLELTSIGKAH